MTREFQECEECACKPGSPPLCSSCLNNRTLIEQLEAKIKELGDYIAAEIVLKIIKESPELVAIDPETHMKNLHVYGTSILYQKKTLSPGEIYGKSPLRNMAGDLTDV